MDRLVKGLDLITGKNIVNRYFTCYNQKRFEKQVRMTNIKNIIGEQCFMNEQNKKTSAVPFVLSLISFIFSFLALINAMILIYIVSFDTQGGTATALNGQAVAAISGLILTIGGTWGFSIIGGLMGVVMAIVDGSTKRTNIIWMPIVAIVVSLISILVSIIAL